MNKKLFRIMLIPMYLLISLFLFCTMAIKMVQHFNIFFYITTLMFLPCSYGLSLTNRKSLNLAGMTGFIALGVLLPVTQSFEFEFQGINGWIGIGGIAVICGIGGFIYQKKQGQGE